MTRPAFARCIQVGVMTDSSRAMPPSAARAGPASPRAVLRRLGHSGTIAIAAFCAVYFGLQLLRGAL